MDEQSNFSLQDFKDRMANNMFGMTVKQARHKHVCISCKNEALQFKDICSRNEYAISGLCQTCQDATFATEDFDIG